MHALEGVYQSIDFSQISIYQKKGIKVSNEQIKYFLKKWGELDAY